MNRRTILRESLARHGGWPCGTLLVGMDVLVKYVNQLAVVMDATPDRVMVQMCGSGQVFWLDVTQVRKVERR